MDKFRERHKLPNLIQEKIDNLNSLILIKEIGYLVVSLKKTASLDSINSIKHLRRKILSILYKTLSKS